MCHEGGPYVVIKRQGFLHQYIAELCVCDKFSEFYTAVRCSRYEKVSHVAYVNDVFPMQQTMTASHSLTLQYFSKLLSK